MYPIETFVLGAGVGTLIYGFGKERSPEPLWIIAGVLTVTPPAQGQRLRCPNYQATIKPRVQHEKRGFAQPSQFRKVAGITRSSRSAPT
jgi:hypothetical protein